MKDLPCSVISVLERSSSLLEPNRQLLGHSFILDLLVQLLYFDVDQLLNQM